MKRGKTFSSGNLGMFYIKRVCLLTQQVCFQESILQKYLVPMPRVIAELFIIIKKEGNKYPQSRTIDSIIVHPYVREAQDAASLLCLGVLNIPP